MDIDDIKRISKEKGRYFFSKDTMRWWHSRVHSATVQDSQGMVYFTTSERPSVYDGDARRYTVRVFNPQTGSVSNASEFMEYSSWERVQTALRKFGSKE